MFKQLKCDKNLSNLPNSPTIISGTKVSLGMVFFYCKNVK